MSRDTRRRIVSVASVIVALVPLAFVLTFVVSQGIQALDLDFFTQIPKPVGEAGGGMGNAILGTVILCAIGAALAIPIGVMSGVFVAEYPHHRLAPIVRFAADTLNGVPSIVIGVFVYAIAVLPFGGFSALAGGIALGVMMIPVITRTTDAPSGSRTTWRSMNSTNSATTRLPVRSQRAAAAAN